MTSPQVDDDIKQLWKEAQPKTREAAETLERALKAEGLISTKQDKPVLEKPKKRKIQRQRASKKPHAHAHLRLPLGA